MGRICDRSKMTRVGKFKPWIRRMCGPVAIASFLMYQSALADAAMGVKTMFLLAIATSIDAFAVGVSFSMQEGIVWLHGGISIFLAVTMIGCTTFVLSLFGVWIGNRFGLRYHRLATIIGGVVLIVIGIKIVLEALGLLPSFLQCDTVAFRDAFVHTLWL